MVEKDEQDDEFPSVTSYQAGRMLADPVPGDEMRMSRQSANAASLNSHFVTRVNHLVL